MNSGSGNGLAPVSAITRTWTNADLISVGNLKTKFSENVFWNTVILFLENTLENVCKIFTICSGLNVFKG